MAVLLVFTQVMPSSNIFLVFLLLYLYGLSIVAFAFMLTPFFDKAEVRRIPSGTKHFIAVVIMLAGNAVE